MTNHHDKAGALLRFLSQILIVAGIALWGRAALASETEPAHYPVYLELDTDALLNGRSAGLVEKRTKVIQEVLVEVLGKNNIDVVDTKDGAAVLHVVFAWESAASSTYLVTVTGTPPGGSPQELSFERTGDHYLMLENIETRMPRILQWFEVNETVPPASLPPSDHEPQPAQTQSSVRPRRFWIAAGVGAAVAVAGLGAATFGVIRLVQSDENKAHIDGNPRNLSRSKRGEQGIIWLGAGLGGVVVGATLIAVDTTVLWKKRKKRASRASVRPMPMVFGENRGIALVGRF